MVSTLTSTTTDTSGGTSTSYTQPALTTLFTPAPSCFDSPTAFVVEDINCLPEDYYVSVADDWQYYSPGICPTGYTAACTKLVGESRIIPQLLPSETAVYCCPTYVALHVPSISSLNHMYSH
jgi:hypothetical protein